jgi:hypothetical protein
VTPVRRLPLRSEQASLVPSAFGHDGGCVRLQDRSRVVRIKVDPQGALTAVHEHRIMLQSAGLKKAGRGRHAEMLGCLHPDPIGVRVVRIDVNRVAHAGIIEVRRCPGRLCHLLTNPAANRPLHWPFMPGTVVEDRRRSISGEPNLS